MESEGIPERDSPNDVAGEYIFRLLLSQSIEIPSGAVINGVTDDFLRGNDSPELWQKKVFKGAQHLAFEPNSSVLASIAGGSELLFLYGSARDCLERQQLSVLSLDEEHHAFCSAAERGDDLQVMQVERSE